MRETEIKEMNLPQLIVGLDSKDEDANYVHVNDVRENVDYYCPCCKGLIKPRAYKKDEQYKMQAHFYHVNGGCTEETYVHYICKNFLFQAGSKFIVKGTEYEVAEVITEKEYTTKFGGYIPDITVITTVGKTFYFEIRNTNKKTTDYIPKWDELGNDVVEVDVRRFVNQKFKDNIPEFKLIYSDGVCFIREYVRKDYEQIERRKLEWKRQDKLNYKIQWEKLDWFWRELQEYIISGYDENKEEKVLESFENLDFEDMDFCIRIIHGHKLREIYEECKYLIDNKFYEIINGLDISPYKSIDFIQESPRIFYIGFEICSVGDVAKWYHSYCLKRHVEYFGKEILDIILKEITKDEKENYTLKQLSRYELIQRYYGQRNLKPKSIRIYLNERPWFYIDDKNEDFNKCYFDWDIYRELSLDSSAPLRKLTKEEHLVRMNKNQLSYEESLLYDFIVKKINSCKNNRWNINICGDWINMSFLDNGYTVYEQSTYIPELRDCSKIDIYRQIVQTMKQMALDLCDGIHMRTGRSSKYIRLMEDRVDG